MHIGLLILCVVWDAENWSWALYMLDKSSTTKLYPQIPHSESLKD